MRLSPQLTVDGTAVHLPVSNRVAPLLDELAILYADRPGDIGALLNRHASTVLALDHAVVSEDSTDYGRAMCAAEADATRDALLDEIDAAAHVDAVLSPDDAISLGTRLTRLAAHIRHRTNRTPHA